MPAEDLDVPRPARPPWTFWLRIAVSLGLLVVLVTQVPDLDFDTILPEGHHLLTVTLLALALLTTLLGIVLSAWRWQRVLVAFRARVPLPRLTSHYLAGQFVGNVLPSTIGGDVLRIARCSRSTGSAETSFASVVLERLTGFVALPFLVLLGFLLRPSLLDVDHAWVALAIAGVTLLVLVAILTVAAHPRLAGRFRDHANWMRFVGAVHQGVDNVRRRPRSALDILGSALAYQSSVVLAVMLIATALDIDVPLAALVAFVPAVAMVQVLPISISGLGVREGMLVLFLGPLGASNAEAIALGLLWYAAILVVSMLGAPAFAVGHRHTAAERGRVDGVRG